MYDTETEKTKKDVETNGERPSYDEEVSTELAQVAPNSAARFDEPARDGKIENSNRGVWLGYAAVIIGLVAFFTFPVLFGIVAIVIGFISRNAGESKVGGWGIGLGIVSVLLGVFIYPFF
ncbi:DUF308 domain-containing protein [Jeotgalibacillus soli]|uniref:DUF4190 domain-containing protein n=1 Tax=Jeotgalibacillus soli TaxID=889306 RepID=A0A0C2VK98_9BACL|nr:DUF308 domain-containing protein [Jeotgalibacillus soli]KIL44418.1 hypothetical protein KP78_33820 [Jeotgalibacillus soli]